MKYGGVEVSTVQLVVMVLAACHVVGVAVWTHITARTATPDHPTAGAPISPLPPPPPPKNDDDDEGERSNLRARLAALRAERAEKREDENEVSAAGKDNDDDDGGGSDLRARLAKLRAEREANEAATETKKSQ